LATKYWQIEAKIVLFSGTVINNSGKKCKNLILYGEKPIRMTTFLQKLN